MATNPRIAVRHVWASVALLAAGVVWYVWYLFAGAGAEALSYTSVPVGGLLAVSAVHQLCRAVPMDPVALRFWRTTMAAFGLITVGYLWLAVDMLAHWDTAAVRQMPVPAALAVGLGFVTAMYGVARVPIGVPAAERGRLLLDRAIAFLGCSTLLWHFGLAPMLAAPHGWSIQAMVLIGLAFLLTVGAITKVAYLRADAVHPASLRLIAGLGLTAAVVAVLAVRGGDHAAVPSQAVVMPIASVLATLAVQAQWRGGARAGHGRAGAWLPYLAMVAIAVPLVAVATTEASWTAGSVIVAAVVVGGLIALRQFMAIRENARLLGDKRAQEERLQHEVTHDSLTGLANRALFHERLSLALTGPERACVLLVDLDDFKAVNDSLGHDVGDRLLVSAASVLRTAGGPGSLAARLGGDEFAVLLPGRLADAEALAARLTEAFGRPLGEDSLLVQASIGIAVVEPGATLDTVLRHADIAMYAAKQRGKAGHVRYEPGMAEPVLAHFQLGAELRRALDAGEFRVFYQPVVGLADRRLIGVEALVRWQHPTRGMVAPAEFIPAAERTGLIVELGRTVLRETCRQMAAWIAEFGPDAPVKVGPNVSGRQLHDPGFVADVRAALADHGLSSDRLVLEVTESSALRGRQVIAALHELDAMGVTLALDDFGTGESSLSLLRAFPASIVKLDKSFVDGIEIDDGDPAAGDARQAVARAVVQLARALRLDAVAEGIENEAQARALRELGYSLGQGFHLAPPMPAEKMTRLLAAARSAVRAA
ncbi:putative bifunctional diguanylate cyclase/phosphodiesterase [Mangrovihabitans endophyticus]|nr:EAL domain-containing protein [Mangrovihabitans endophyticus]